jgi:hypothetical protein
MSPHISLSRPLRVFVPSCAILGPTFYFALICLCNDTVNAGDPPSFKSQLFEKGTLVYAQTRAQVQLQGRPGLPNRV